MELTHRANPETITLIQTIECRVGGNYLVGNLRRKAHCREALPNSPLSNIISDNVALELFKALAILCFMIASPSPSLSLGTTQPTLAFALSRSLSARAPPPACSFLPSSSSSSSAFSASDAFAASTRLLRCVLPSSEENGRLERRRASPTTAEQPNSKIRACYVTFTSTYLISDGQKEFGPRARWFTAVNSMRGSSATQGSRRPKISQ